MRINGMIESLEALSRDIVEVPDGESIEMDRFQYAEYKRLVWEWMSSRPDPIMQFVGHPIVVIKKSEEPLSTGSSELANNEV